MLVQQLDSAAPPTPCWQACTGSDTRVSENKIRKTKKKLKPKKSSGSFYQMTAQINDKLPIVHIIYLLLSENFYNFIFCSYIFFKLFL